MSAFLSAVEGSN